MIIAVNTRFWVDDLLEGVGNFTRETALRLASEHPKHQFYFLFDRPLSNTNWGENVKTLVLPPPARHPVLWKYWFDVKVAAALRKIKADVFLSYDGFCSLTTSVPQCLVVHDLGFLHRPASYRKAHLLFYKYYVPRFLKKARSIATVSQTSRADLISRFPILEEKISVVYNGVKPVFGPVSSSVKEEIRHRYTSGHEYFLYVGAIQPRKNLLNLLKAFSLFKKRQQSGMKLVLAGRVAWKADEFTNLLKTYKYRSDVVLTGFLPDDELARLMGTAYAAVYPSFFEGFGVPVLEAMRSGVPVLTSSGTSMQEICEEAGLYFDPADPADIGDKLMRIYKDEVLRDSMIQKGSVIATRYTWERSSALLWEAVVAAAEKPKQTR